MKKILIPIAVIIVGAIVWYLASPLFIDNEVNEELVFDKTARAPETNQEETADLPREERPGETITETTKNDFETVPTEQQDPEGPAVSGSSEPPPPAPSGPLVLANGSFSGTDALHKGSGEAYIVQTEDGNILRFEDFDVTNGPDLRVLLSTSADPEASIDDYIEVGELKGNVGNQNYMLDASIDIDDYKHVIIYCKPFHVVFATAPLQ